MKKPNKYKIVGAHIEVTLSSGEIMLCDKEDWEKLRKHSWSKDTTGYACSGSFRKKMAFHREIKKAPKGLVVDHINRNKLDNRKTNLRIVTPSINLHNREAKGITKIKGYEKWVAQITINKKHMYLGSYDSEEEAMNVYKKVKDEYMKSQANKKVNGTLAGNIKIN